MEKYIPIGSTKKIHGIKGELKLAVEDHYLDDLLQTDVVFLMTSGQPAPYFIEDLYFKNSLIVKFEDIDSPEAARPLAGTELLLRSSDMIAKQDRPAQQTSATGFQRFTGYTLVDVEMGEIGRIESVESFPQQEIAIVKSGEKEWLIPLNNSYILKISEEKRQLQVALPDGLLDL